MSTGEAPNEQAKMWAALSYGSFFVGIPLGVVPLIQRDDAFALQHAKHATAVWLGALISGSLLAVVYFFISFVTCGFGSLLFPILFLPVGWSMIVGIHGLILSLNGDWSEPIGTFGLGNLLFSSIQPKTDVELAAEAQSRTDAAAKAAAARQAQQQQKAVPPAAAPPAGAVAPPTPPPPPPLAPGPPPLPPVDSEGGQ